MPQSANETPGVRKVFIRLVRTSSCNFETPLASTFPMYYRIAAAFALASMNRSVGSHLTAGGPNPASVPNLNTYLRLAGLPRESVEINPALLGGSAPSQGPFSIRTTSGKLSSFRLNAVKEVYNFDVSGTGIVDNVSIVRGITGDADTFPFSPLSVEPRLTLQMRSGSAVYSPGSSSIGYDQTGQFFKVDYALARPESKNGCGYYSTVLTNPHFRRLAITDVAVGCPVVFAPITKFTQADDTIDLRMELIQEFEIEVDVSADLPQNDGLHVVARSQWRFNQDPSNIVVRVLGDASTYASGHPTTEAIFTDIVASQQTTGYLALRIDDINSPDQRNIASDGLLKVLNLQYDAAYDNPSTPSELNESLRLYASSVSLL